MLPCIMGKLEGHLQLKISSCMSSALATSLTDLSAKCVSVPTITLARHHPLPVPWSKVQETQRDGQTNLWHNNIFINPSTPPPCWHASARSARPKTRRTTASLACQQGQWTDLPTCNVHHLVRDAKCVPWRPHYSFENLFILRAETKGWGRSG